MGSLGRNLKLPSEGDRVNVVNQLIRYLHAIGHMGYRWQDKIVGMAIIGTEFKVIESDGNGAFDINQPWYSLYSPTFFQTIHELNTV